jgi:UDP-galactopyranose mutase
MNTFYQIYGAKDPEEAAFKIMQDRVVNFTPKNLKEQAISLVGKKIYKTLIKGYTEKQ